ncbi:hypothetical protein L1280_001731 [Deinococcus sp. HSC-46F16]|nr:hypothetical protein [Deinococcus sp. HSC-46F16]
MTMIGISSRRPPTTTAAPGPVVAGEQGRRSAQPGHVQVMAAGMGDRHDRHRVPCRVCGRRRCAAGRRRPSFRRRSSPRSRGPPDASRPSRRCGVPASTVGTAVNVLVGRLQCGQQIGETREKLRQGIRLRVSHEGSSHRSGAVRQRRPQPVRGAHGLGRGLVGTVRVNPIPRQHNRAGDPFTDA